MDAYRKGLSGKQAAWAGKKYRGHRVLPASLLDDLAAAQLGMIVSSLDCLLASAHKPIYLPLFPRLASGALSCMILHQLFHSIAVFNYLHMCPGNLSRSEASVCRVLCAAVGKFCARLGLHVIGHTIVTSWKVVVFACGLSYQQ